MRKPVYLTDDERHLVAEALTVVIDSLGGKSIDTDRATTMARTYTRERLLEVRKLFFDKGKSL